MQMLSLRFGGRRQRHQGVPLQESTWMAKTVMPTSVSLGNVSTDSKDHG